MAKFYKTVIQVEVLSAERYVWSSLEDVLYDITKGSESGHVSEVEQVEIDEEALVRECDKHGTDPSYFLDFAEELEEDDDMWEGVQL